MKLKRCSLNALICTVVTVTADLPAAAQTDTDITAAGRACFSIEQDTRRLACFERAFGSDAASESSQPVPATVGPAAPAAVVTAAPAAADTAVAAAAGVTQATVTGADSAAPERSGSAPGPASSAAAPEQVQIVGTREIRPGDVRLQTADGLIYYHDGSRLRPVQFPATPFMATMERGALGSRFLRFGPENSQRIRVTERN